MVMNSIEYKQDPLLEIITLEKLAENRPDLFTVERLKWLIRNRDSNGLAKAKAIVKIGKSFRILYEPFTKWYLEYIKKFID
jgi:hypothetical protein